MATSDPLRFARRLKCRVAPTSQGREGVATKVRRSSDPLVQPQPSLSRLFASSEPGKARRDGTHAVDRSGGSERFLGHGREFGRG